MSRQLSAISYQLAAGGLLPSSRGSPPVCKVSLNVGFQPLAASFQPLATNLDTVVIRLEALVPQAQDQPLPTLCCAQSL